MNNYKFYFLIILLLIGIGFNSYKIHELEHKVSMNTSAIVFIKYWEKLTDQQIDKLQRNQVYILADYEEDK